MGSQNFEQLMNIYSGIKTGCGIAAIIFLAAAIALFFLLKIPTVFSELSGRGAKKAIEEMTAENDSGGLSSSRKIGDDGRRHKKARTGMLGTTKLRKNTSRMTGNLNTGRLSKGLVSMENGAAGQGAYTDSNMQMQSEQTAGSMQQSFSQAGQEFTQTQQGQVFGQAGQGFGQQQFGGQQGYESQGSDETTVMNAGTDETTVMNTGADETTVMNTGAGETAMMNQTGDAATTPLAGGDPYATMVLSQNDLPKKKNFVIERSIVEVHTDEVI